jgi:hypothetical protein
MSETEWARQWIADGFPWCDTCKRPAVFNEQMGNLHVTEERRWGLYPHEDPADHRPTFREWSEQGMRDRTAR